MPWSQVSPMDSRQQMIAEYLTGLYSITELAATYGVSRRIAHHWINRYTRDGPAGLMPASRRPHTSPGATPPALVERICAARRAHPTWGAGTLRHYLQRIEPHQPWPCRDTFHEVLARRGLVRQRRPRRRAVHAPGHLTQPTTPNLVWTTDYKGEFRTRDGAWCYPFTLRDGCSRYVLRCTALACHTFAVTYQEFLRAFHTYGLPDRIRSDNGPPFASGGLARLSRLAVWWIRLGIVPERITPGHPEQNGAHEQFHAVLKRETPQPQPAASRRAQQARFQRFVTEYNQDRPHTALEGRPPALVYRASPRAYPTTLPPLDYATTALVRRVNSSGAIKWRSRMVFLSEVLAGEDVALEPIDDGVYVLRFATVVLAQFDERRWLLLPAVPAAAISAGPRYP